MKDEKIITVGIDEDIKSVALETLLKGIDGKDGRDGRDGIDGKNGIDGRNGKDGIDGKDAKINGINTITISSGKNIDITQIDDALTINDTYEYDDSDLRNQINQVNELAEQSQRDITNLDNRTTHIEEDIQDIDSSLNHLADTKQDTLIAGDNITIVNNVISSTGGGGDLSEYVKKTELAEQKYAYVKDGLVNNNITLTDEEQIKVEDWLGLAENYLTYYNETPYQVNNNYNPAHKKYVDESDSALRERISEIELSKFPNATIIGTPTIQQGQISNFSLSDYLEFPFLVDFRNRPFEINFAFTTGQDIDNQQNILDSDFGLAFAIRNKHLVLAISFNGTSWATEQTGSLTLESQITYRIKITWNGLLYKVQYSLDGGNTYVDDITFGSNQSPYPKQMYIGTGKLARNYFKGIINMNYADVSVGGNKIWLGMDDAGLALRMSVSMDNIDSVGIQKVKDIASEVIPDMNKYLDKNYTGINELAGKIQIGNKDTNVNNAILHIRNVGNSSITGKSVNGACYAINSDGTATLQHKIYNDDGTGAKNSAILRMSNQGIQFAINTGTGASPTEDMYKELATREYVDNVITGALGGSY